jgi:hypothetical protein
LVCTEEGVDGIFASTAAVLSILVQLLQSVKENPMLTRFAWSMLVSLSLTAVCVAQDLPPSGVFVEDVGGGLTLRLLREGGHGPRPTAVPVLIAEPLPADAQALIKVYNGEAEAIRQKAEQEVQARQKTLITALQALQDSYTRDAKLDEAVAIRDLIRQLKVSHLNAQPDPGNLSEYGNRIGETFYFDIVGVTGYSVWGSEVYTYDSHLATAAVHAGVLKAGQRGVVKVTMVKSPEAHRGSTQNGVTTSNWGPYSASYTVESAIPNVPTLKDKPAQPVERKI